MSARVFVERRTRTSVIAGRGADVVPALKLTRCPRQFDQRINAWRIPTGMVDDVVAAIENRLGGDAVQVVDLP